MKEKRAFAVSTGNSVIAVRAKSVRGALRKAFAVLTARGGGSIGEESLGELVQVDDEWQESAGKTLYLSTHDALVRAGYERKEEA